MTIVQCPIRRRVNLFRCCRLCSMSTNCLSKNCLSTNRPCEHARARAATVPPPAPTHTQYTRYPV